MLVAPYTSYRFRIALIALLVLCLEACTAEPDPHASPKQLLRAYLEAVDQNRYAEARSLSTPAEQARLLEVEAMLAGELSENSLLETRILTMDCLSRNDTCICLCRLQDQYEDDYPQYFRMLQRRGKWLMDAPLSEWEEEAFRLRLERNDPNG